MYYIATETFFTSYGSFTEGEEYNLRNIPKDIIKQWTTPPSESGRPLFIKSKREPLPPPPVP